MKKIVSVITLAAAAASLSLTASAYTIDFDLGFGWSANTTIPGSEFADVTPETTVTITYEANKALADMPGNDYWCIKPMINDEGWPFIDSLGLELSESKDSYPVDVEGNSVSFTIPADVLEHIQVAGVAFMGHGVKLLDMTFSEGAAPESKPDNTDNKTDTAPENPASGVEGVAAVVGVAAVALGAMVVTAKKRK